jgi:phosphoglycerate dehydrogenase-like enzyme
MYSNFVPSAAHLRRLHDAAPGREVAVCGSEADALRLAGDAEVFLGHRYLRQSVPHAPRLRWVQSTAGGLDHVVSRPLIERAVKITRCNVNADSVALHAVTLLLAMVRCLPEAVLAQARGEWAAPFAMLELPRRAAVLGMGPIGRAIAAHLQGLGVEVIGVARHADAEAARSCAQLCVDGSWRALLHSVDACMIALPLTRLTRGLVDRSALAALPDHALVVNVGRGAVLDVTALAERLHAGRLGGAALDVLDEPPSAGDPLWTVPRLLITPKVASYHPAMQARIEAFVEAQLGRYVRGEPLIGELAPAQAREMLKEAA